MGIVFRQSVKSVIVTFGGALLGVLVIILSSKMIPKQELGFSRYLTNQTIVVSQVMMLGLQSTLAVYSHRYDAQDPRRRTIITLSLALPLLALLLMSGAYFLLKDYLIGKYPLADQELIRQFFFLFPCLTLLFTYQTILEIFLISQMKPAVAAFNKEITLRVLNIALILLFGLQLIPFSFFIIASVLIYTVPVGILYWLSTRTPGFGYAFQLGSFSRAERKEIFSFTWYHVLLSISVNLMGYLDSIMLEHYGQNGFESVAVYTNAVFIMSVLVIPYRTMANASSSLLIQAFRDKDKERVSDLFHRSSVNILIAGTAMAVLICCNLHNAVVLMEKGSSLLTSGGSTAKSFAAVTPLVLIMMIGRMADISTGMNEHVLSYSSHYRFSFYTSLILLITLLVLNRVLIPAWGIYGAAWSSSIALLLYNAAKWLFVWLKLKLQPFSARTLKILLAGGITWALCSLIPVVAGPVPDALLRTLVIIPVYLVLLLSLKVSPDLQTYVASVRKNKRFF